MRTILLFVITALSLAYAQETTLPPRHFTRERTYDVLHYKLDLDLDERAKRCSGDVTIRLVPLRTELEEILLDAAEMSIQWVKLGQQTLRYQHIGDSLLITLDRPYGLHDTLNILIAYSITAPKKGMYFIEPDSAYPHKTYQIWTQGESEDNHYWFPCYDFPNDLSSSELTATVNEKFTVISNGELVDVKRNPKQHRASYHWSEPLPHVSYLISLVAGEYTEVKDSSGIVPISSYVYPYQRDIAKFSFGNTAKMMKLYSEKIGYRYPWKKYAQTVVEDFIYGGEENVNATTLNDNTIHDERAHLEYSSDGLVAHELAHQWWGDLVSFRDWSHAWLSEGFATYFEMVFQEFDKSPDDAAKEILEAQTSVVVSDIGDKRRPTVCDRFNAPSDVFDNRIYAKGACVLHMLRQYLGDELFWKSINYYIHKHAFNNVETNDFKVAIEEATGYNLHWFFEQWVYKPGYPDFEVVSKWNSASRNLELTVKQVQALDSLTGLFTVPLDIQVWVNGNPETYRVTVSQKEETFTFPAYQEPQLVIFDKCNTILKRVTFNKPIEEWIYQLQHASDGIDRYHAVDELRWVVDSAHVVDALRKAALDDRFWDVRRNAVFALGDSHNPSVGDTLLTMYGDRDARVRNAVVTALRNFRGEQIIKTLRYAFEKDPSYVVAASALSSLIEVDSLNVKQYCNQGLQRNSFRESIRIAALRGLEYIGDDESLQSMMNFTRYGNEGNLRYESLRMLSRRWKEREDVVQYLIGMLSDPSFNVRRAVIGFLGNIGNTKALGPLQQTTLRESDTRLVKAARESMEKIRKAQDNHN